jgi:predicted GIY-YIG superfamily endonuclease
VNLVNSLQRESNGALSGVEGRHAKTYFVYFLRCVDGSLYAGHTESLETREKTHNEGRAARYTAIRRPVRLVYAETFESLEAAVCRERQLKRWSPAKKEALIVGDIERLKLLSRRRS